MPKDNGLELYGRYRRQYESYIFGRRICALSWKAEAFFWRCHSGVADDYGNFPVDPFILIPKAAGLRKMEPHECIEIVREMEAKGLIRLYFVGEDDCYGHILSFTKTQPPTGAPRGGRLERTLGRKRQYPESPWDNDIPLSEQPRYTASTGGPTSPSESAHDKDNDKDKRIGPATDRPDPSIARGLDKRDFVVQGFTYWQEKLKHPHAQLSPERVRCLEARWKDSSLNEWKLAVDGCESSDFHMGRQPNNPAKFDDVTLIGRNRAKLEFFMEKVKDKRKTTDDTKRRSQEAGQRWRGNG